MDKLELPAPAGLLLSQQLALLRELARRIREDEQDLAAMLELSPALHHVRSLPGMGPILAAVIVSEIDTIERFPSAQKLCGYAGLCPSTSSSGGKTFQGKLLLRCNKWLRWAFVEAAWVAVGCSPYFGDFYRRKRSLGKKANSAILATARLMARITWQLLTQGRDYANFPMDQELRCRPIRGSFSSAVQAKESNDFRKPSQLISSQQLSPAAPMHDWLVAKPKA